MKRIKDKVKLLKFEKRKQKKALRRKRYYKNWKKNQNRSNLRISKSRRKERNKVRSEAWGYTQVKAPEIFAFNTNTEEVVGFIQKIEELYTMKRQVFVTLKKVKEIDYGAIVVLLSIMVKFKSRKIKFNGDFPKDPEALIRLTKSGFFANLGRSFKEEDKYEISGKGVDGILTHASKLVDSILGDRVIKAASKTIWGETRRCQGVQRVLIELMQNTNNHAAIGKEGEKHWWLSVNHIENEKKVCFAFVDFGVGVFKSLDNKPSNSKWSKWPEKITRRFRYGNNADLLKYILEGEFHQTVTGKSFRGKGLPGIAQVMQRNQISNLKIVTNNTFCSWGLSIFKTMGKSFNGTYIYWEVNNSNESCR